MYPLACRQVVYNRRTDQEVCPGEGVDNGAPEIIAEYGDQLVPTPTSRLAGNGGKSVETRPACISSAEPTAGEARITRKRPTDISTTMRWAVCGWEMTLPFHYPTFAYGRTASAGCWSSIGTAHDPAAAGSTMCLSSSSGARQRTEPRFASLLLRRICSDAGRKPTV